MINRRHLILSTAALALSATIATPAAEVRTVHMVTIRTVWYGFGDDTPSFSQVPVSTLPYRPYYHLETLDVDVRSGRLLYVEEV